MIAKDTMADSNKRLKATQEIEKIRHDTGERKGKIAKGIKTGHLMGKIPTIVDLIFDAIGVESNLSQLAEIQDLFVRVPDIASVMMYDYYTNTYWQQFTKVFKGGYDYALRVAVVLLGSTFRPSLNSPDSAM